MKKIYIFFIRLYQLIFSPILTNLLNVHCRFPVSCSRYAIQAIEDNGIYRGSILSIQRILRCQPFTKIYEYS